MWWVILQSSSHHQLAWVRRRSFHPYILYLLFYFSQYCSLTCRPTQKFLGVITSCDFLYINLSVSLLLSIFSTNSLNYSHSVFVCYEKIQPFIIYVALESAIYYWIYIREKMITYNCYLISSHFITFIYILKCLTLTLLRICDVLSGWVLIKQNILK